jgi:hypothetical protein
MQKCKIHKGVFYTIVLLLETYIGHTILALIKPHFQLYNVNTPYWMKTTGPNATKQQFM